MLCIISFLSWRLHDFYGKIKRIIESGQRMGSCESVRQLVEERGGERGAGGIAHGAADGGGARACRTDGVGGGSVFPGGLRSRGGTCGGRHAGVFAASSCAGTRAGSRDGGMAVFAARHLAWPDARPALCAAAAGGCRARRRDSRGSPATPNLSCYSSCWQRYEIFLFLPLDLAKRLYLCN